MAYGGCEDEDYLQGLAKLSIKSGKSGKIVDIARGKRGKNLAINEELFNKLYDYQKEGVRWLFDLFEKGRGGILGDDMGLGKTIQMIAFLSGMMDCKFIRCALIIAPMSVINVWCTSFKEFSPRTNYATFHGEKRAREKALERIQDRGGILITTYDLVGREGERLGRDGYGDAFEWDYLVADEGHQLKNKSIKRSQGAHSVPTKYRIILTGTPLQNRLPELWALFDFTHFGQLLGTMRTFNANYGNAIEEGRKKCATARTRQLGNQFAESLRKIIEPYLLRRTKDEVGLGNRPASGVSQQRATSSASDGTGSPSIPRQLMPSLPRKNDFVIWLTLSREQEDIYRRFLTTPEVKMLLDPSVKTSPLTQLLVLKKLCDHPRLLSENACQTLGITFDRNMGEHQAELGMGMGAGSAARVPSALEGNEEVDDLAVCIEQSIKTSFLKALLPQLIDEGHKVLVFSMSLRMLNVVAQILKNRLGIKFLRLDGRVTKLEERQKILEKFQSSERYKVLLLTTQVGGVGLTITAADRVVIVDPAWNPAVDSQAVDRVYRVGQKRNVVIYRLITAGTVEEKIYRRQVFKVSIFKQVAHSSKGSVQNIDDPMRYFTQQDLKELFKLNDTKSSDTQHQLEAMHAHQRVSDAELDGHVGFVTGLPGVAGISDHDLLFSKPDDPSLENGEEEERVRQLVERAKAQMEQENLNPNAGAGDGIPRQRHPLGDKQPITINSDSDDDASPPPIVPPVQATALDQDMYPRGFGDIKTAAPKFDQPSMQLPSDVPLYLQRKGLIKPGQTVLTPPKLIGRGQKEKSFTLHRSFSDAELNAANDDNGDGANGLHRNEPIVVDSDSADETMSLNESLVNRNRQNHRPNRINDSEIESGGEARGGMDDSDVVMLERPEPTKPREDPYRRHRIETDSEAENEDVAIIERRGPAKPRQDEMASFDENVVNRNRQRRPNRIGSSESENEEADNNGTEDVAMVHTPHEVVQAERGSLSKNQHRHRIDGSIENEGLRDRSDQDLHPLQRSNNGKTVSNDNYVNVNDDSNSADDTIPLALEESLVHRNRQRKPNRIETDSESEREEDEEADRIDDQDAVMAESHGHANEPLEDRSQSARSRDSNERRAHFQQPEEVVDLALSDSDKDDDVQLVEPPKPAPGKRESAASLYATSTNNHRDSIIRTGRKGRNRRIIEDDSDDEDTQPVLQKNESGAAAIAENTSAKTGTFAADNIVIFDEDGNEHIEPMSAANLRKFPRNSASIDGTPAFGALPIISSTPFNPIGAAGFSKNTESRQRSFPSSITLAISPLSAATKSSRLSADETEPRFAIDKAKATVHGKKRASYDRSIEVLDSDNSRNQSTNIIPNSVVETEDDDTQEYDDERTGSTESTATADGQENSGEQEVVDETEEEESQSPVEEASESAEEHGENEDSQLTDEDEEGSEFYKTAATTTDRSTTYNDDESSSRISLPNADKDCDASFAY